MGFHLIDFENWERKERFSFFMENTRATCSLTVNIDITKLKAFLIANSLKFYPAMILIVTKFVNENKNFRLRFDECGRLGYFDELNPSYTLINEETKDFFCLNSTYSKDLNKLYVNLVNDMEKYKNSKTLFPKVSYANEFYISCLPWISYTECTSHDITDGKDLRPSIVWGKYFKHDSKIMLPLTLWMNHAAVDGWHMAQFFESVQKDCDNIENLISIKGDEIC